MTEELKRRVIEFPPDPGPCQRCGVKLRLATREEINADLRSSIKQYKEMAEWSAQGDRTWLPPEHFSEWDKYAASRERPSWQFRCDQCGLRLLYSRAKDEE